MAGKGKSVLGSFWYLSMYNMRALIDTKIGQTSLIVTSCYMKLPFLKRWIISILIFLQWHILKVLYFACKLKVIYR